MHLYHPTQFMRYHKLLCIYLRAYTAPLAYPSFISTQICSLHLNLTPTCLLFHPRYCILASFISIWETWRPRWYPTGCLDCWRKVNAGIFMQKKTHKNFTWPPHPEDWARLANWMQFCPLVSSSLKGMLKGMWWTILVIQQSYLCNPGRYMIQGNSWTLFIAI